MLPLGLFRRRNFAVGNLETLVVDAGLSVLQFFLMLFLQQVAGWDAREAGMAMVPTTLIMFALPRYTGRLADRYGPRMFMGGGPLIAAAGLALLTRVGAHVDYVTDLLPAIVVFALGLALTVAPLTSTVLADADERNAPPPERARIVRATEDASVKVFHIGAGIAGALVAGGGMLGLVGIVNPRRYVCAAECAGGQLAGAPAEAAREPPLRPRTA